MLLQPLQASFKRHGAYLLELPSTAVRPGAALGVRGELIADLQEVEGFLPRIRLAAPTVARFLVDDMVFERQVTAGLEVGAAGLASVAAGARAARRVRVTVGNVWTQRLEQDGEVLHALDWLHAINEARGLPELQPLVERMRRRLVGFPVPRLVDLVQAAVYVEQLSFHFEGDGGVGIEASADLVDALGADLRAGLDVQWQRGGSLVWNARDVPIGFLPVRYAWNPMRGRFSLARW